MPKPSRSMNITRKTIRRARLDEGSAGSSASAGIVSGVTSCSGPESCIIKGPCSPWQIAVFSSLYKLTRSLQFSRFAGHRTLSPRGKYSMATAESPAVPRGEENKDPSYLIFDSESVPDGRLVRLVKYPKENISDAEAIQRAQVEAHERYGTDFLPVSFQIPVAICVIRVAA